MDKELQEDDLTEDTADASDRLSEEELEAVKQLDETLAVVFDQRAAAQRNKRHGFDQPWEILARQMCLLTPQSYGTRLQNYFCEYFDWSKVPASLDRGDAIDGGHVEIKTSVLTRSNRSVNLVQIRPYQDIAGYRCFVIDSGADYVVHRFDLTAAQMKSEIALVGSNAHGTKQAANQNSNREYAVRFSLSPDDTTAIRWMSNYHHSTFMPERLTKRLEARALAQAEASAAQDSETAELPDSE